MMFSKANASILDQHITEKLLLSQAPSPEELEACQMALLQKQLLFVKERSSFWGKMLRDIDISSLKCYRDLTKLPLIDAETIKMHGPQMVCLDQSAIRRIVTLHTSGSSDCPKRLYFSEADLELTSDFFHKGMLSITGSPTKVMIFMPCQTDYGIGSLLKKGLLRYGARVIPYGLIEDYAHAAAILQKEKPDCVVGAPIQMLRLSEYTKGTSIPQALLSSDYVAKSVRSRIRKNWKSDIYLHYGLTETGYGCAVDCCCHKGQHIRHADLLIEILDPVTHLPCPPNVEGEIVITTLTREAMPLIRYRTGDRSSLITRPCACGSPYPRLGEVHSRLEAEIILRDQTILSIGKLDEILFSFLEVSDYTASYDIVEERLSLTLQCAGAFSPNTTLLAIKQAIADQISPALWVNAAWAETLDHSHPSPKRQIIIQQGAL